MASYLITGASKGIGLELARQLIESSRVRRVFAISRSAAPSELQDLVAKSSGRVIHVQADVNTQASVDEAVRTVTTALDGEGLDVLINNAAAQWPSKGGISTMTVEQLQSLFSTNVCTVQRVILAFLPLLRKGNGKKIVNISSTLGSISTARLWAAVPVPAYKVSKAALNMLSAQYAAELEDEGFAVVTASPGNLRTDLGGWEADLDVTTGVKAFLKLIQEADRAQNGKFLNIKVPGWEDKSLDQRYDGKEWPW